MSELQEKVKASIDRLKTFQRDEGYYLAFSGGKDSVVCKALLDMANRLLPGGLIPAEEGEAPIPDDMPLKGCDVEGGGVKYDANGNIIDYGIVGPPGACGCDSIPAEEV